MSDDGLIKVKRGELFKSMYEIAMEDREVECMKLADALGVDRVGKSLSELVDLAIAPLSAPADDTATVETMARELHTLLRNGKATPYADGEEKRYYELVVRRWLEKLPQPDAAEVLAGLREEMTAVRENVVKVMQFGLSGIDPYCGRPDDEERWMKRLAEWADWIHGEYVNPVEAAQQRLADRGQSGGSDGAQ